jgi:hypothetical protein
MSTLIEEPTVSNEEKLNERLEEVVINNNYYRNMLMQIALSPTKERITTLAAIMEMDTKRTQEILNEVR